MYRIFVYVNITVLTIAVVSDVVFTYTKIPLTMLHVITVNTTVFTVSTELKKKKNAHAINCAKKNIVALFRNDFAMFCATVLPVSVAL